MNAPTVRSGHTAVYRPAASELVVFGGFNGVALNDVVGFAVPTQFCSRHETEVGCLADPSDCAWNMTLRGCIYTSVTAPELVRRNASVADCLTSQQECRSFVRVRLFYFVLHLDYRVFTGDHTNIPCVPAFVLIGERVFHTL